MRLPLEFFLALRYLRPRRTFVSAITVLSVLGVTLGVTVLIVVLSVMAGFEEELQSKIIGFNAQLTVTNGDILQNADELVQRLEQHPGVAAATPFAAGPVMVQYAGKISTPVLRGIAVDSEERVIPFHKYLVAGEFELRGDSVLVGQEWARRNGAYVGDKILIFTPRHYEALQHGIDGKSRALLLPDELTITGIFSTGLFDYDLNFLVTSLENMQRFYQLGQGVHGVAVRLDRGDPEAVEQMKRSLNQELRPPFLVRSWMDQNRTLFSAIATERVVMTFILFFIMIVAAFGLCSTLITITVQKSREIGLLKALGARDSQVLAVFVLHGLVVGVIGAISGVGLAVLALAYRNDFRWWLSRTFGVDAFSADVYSFANIPAVSNPALMVIIAFSAVGICVLAALIPAQGAARIAPAKALRYE